MPEGYVLCQGNSSVSWQDYAKKKSVSTKPGGRMKSRKKLFKCWCRFWYRVRCRNFTLFLPSVCENNFQSARLINTQLYRGGILMYNYSEVCCGLLHKTLKTHLQNFQALRGQMYMSYETYDKVFSYQLHNICRLLINRGHKH